MRKQRINIIYIQYIFDAIEKIAAYQSTHNFEQFSQEEWDQDAVSRNLEIIGEAANNLDEAYRNQFSDVPWRKIIDFRNIIVHDYADLDIAILWQIISKDLPILKEKISKILDRTDQ